MDIMTKDHERWEEFGDELIKTLQHCTHNLATTKAILTRMGVNVSESLAHFADYGGYCDCEVIYNVILA